MKLLRYCYPFKRYQFRSSEMFLREIFRKMTELGPYCYTKGIVALIPRAVGSDRRLHFKLLLSLASQKWALFKWHTQLHSKHIEWQRNNTVDCLLDYLLSTRNDIIASCFLAGSGFAKNLSHMYTRETTSSSIHEEFPVAFKTSANRTSIILFQLFDATVCSLKKPRSCFFQFILIIYFPGTFGPVIFFQCRCYAMYTDLYR